jgi:hypothetical protein
MEIKIKMKIEVLHNISRDASFGLNTVFHSTQPGGYVKKTEVVKVFEYGQDDSGYSAERVLEDVFRLLNVGDDPGFGTPSEVAKSYRARSLRSLSVGDVVVLDGQAWSAESVGWQPRQPDELKIVTDVDEADRLIRERYQIGQAEPLTVTVPWVPPVTPVVNENGAEILVVNPAHLGEFIEQVNEQAAEAGLPRELTYDELRATPAGTVLHWTNWPGTPSVPVTRLPDDDPDGNVQFADGRKLSAMPDELTRVPRAGLEVHA